MDAGVLAMDAGCMDADVLAMDAGCMDADVLAMVQDGCSDVLAMEHGPAPKMALTHKLTPSWRSQPAPLIACTAAPDIQYLIPGTWYCL